MTLQDWLNSHPGYQEFTEKYFKSSTEERLKKRISCVPFSSSNLEKLLSEKDIRLYYGKDLTGRAASTFAYDHNKFAIWMLDLYDSISERLAVKTFIHELVYIFYEVASRYDEPIEMIIDDVAAGFITNDKEYAMKLYERFRTN